MQRTATAQALNCPATHETHQTVCHRLGRDARLGRSLKMTFLRFSSRSRCSAKAISARPMPRPWAAGATATFSSRSSDIGDPAARERELPRGGDKIRGRAACEELVVTACVECRLAEPLERRQVPLRFLRQPLNTASTCDRNRPGGRQLHGEDIEFTEDLPLLADGPISEGGTSSASTAPSSNSRSKSSICWPPVSRRRNRAPTTLATTVTSLSVV
jgi:hypothetical protein